MYGKMTIVTISCINMHTFDSQKISVKYCIYYNISLFINDKKGK